MRSAKIPNPKEPLVIHESVTPIPESNQVLIRVDSVGVCHSDLHLWEGGYDLGDGQFMKVTDRGVSYPITPGHEIVGTISKVGPSVSDVKADDQVLVYPWIGCKECPACINNNENLCDTPCSMGVFTNGGYSDYVLVPDAKYVVKLDGINPDSATSLACSGLTAYNAIKRSINNNPKYLIVVGAGGLGLMGVQLARVMTSAKIICVDLDDQKLGTAKEMGADYTVNSRDPDTVQKILDICDGKGADSIVDFVNAPPTVKLGLAILRKRGVLTLVGLFGGSLEVSLVTIPLKSITIQGAYTGNYNDMVELMQLARDGKINPVISKRYSLDDANTALNDLKERRIIGRAVINP